MIHLLKECATPVQMQEMLRVYENMVKITVDIRRHILAGGGEMHAHSWATGVFLIADENIRKQVGSAALALLGGIQ